MALQKPTRSEGLCFLLMEFELIIRKPFHRAYRSFVMLVIVRLQLILMVDVLAFGRARVSAVRLMIPIDRLLAGIA